MSLEKTFCFNLRDANNGTKLSCGTIQADTMEDAAVRIAHRLQLVLEIEGHWDRYVLWHKDRRVNLHITAIPEYVLIGKIPSFISPSVVDDPDEEENEETDSRD